MANELNISIDEHRLRQLVVDHFRSLLGDVEIQTKDVNILVKSQQNYKSEWETASFKATVRKGL